MKKIGDVAQQQTGDLLDGVTDPAMKKALARFQKTLSDPKHQKHIEEQERIQKAQQRAQVVQFPLWPEPARGVPNSALRGALFGAVQGKNRQALKRELLPVQEGVEIRFTGWQLDQSDLDVWEQALHLSRLHPLGTRCEFTVYAFLKALGRKTGKSQHEQLKDSFARLNACSVEITHNGMTYFGSLIEGGARDEQTGLYCIQVNPDDHKQDCERNAFYRLAARLKAYFPRLPILLLLDGLYPNGPLLAICRGYGWQFMIVLPDSCLASIWEEVKALKPRQINATHGQIWHGRQQHFWWVNELTYSFNNGAQQQTVHVVGCEETWPVLDADSALVLDQYAQQVWLSSQPLHRHNVHERCNLGARRRWGIETSFLIEKRQGYYYEHAFSLNWNAMKGYHALMRLAHLLNALALATKRVRRHLTGLGVQAFLRFVRETCAHRWLTPAWLDDFRTAARQLRLE